MNIDNIDYLLKGCSKDYIKFRKSKNSYISVFENKTHEELYNFLTDFKQYESYKYLISVDYENDKNKVIEKIKSSEAELQIDQNEIYLKYKKESVNEIHTLTKEIDQSVINSNVRMIDSIAGIKDIVEDSENYSWSNKDDIYSNYFKSLLRKEKNCVIYSNNNQSPLFNFNLFQNHLFTVESNWGNRYIPKTVGYVSYSYLFDLNSQLKHNKNFKFIDSFEIIGPYLLSLIKLLKHPNSSVNRKTLLYIKSDIVGLFHNILDRPFWKMLHFNPDITLDLNDNYLGNLSDIDTAFKYNFSNVNKDLLKLFEYRYVFNEFHNLIVEQIGSKNDEMIKYEIKKIYENYNSLMYRTDIPYFIPTKAKFGIG